MTATDVIKETLLAHRIDTYQNTEHDETRWICTNPECTFETDNWSGNLADERIAEHHSEKIVKALKLKEVWGYRRDSHIDYIDTEVGLLGFARLNLIQKGGVLIKREAMPWEEVGDWVEPEDDDL